MKTSIVTVFVLFIFSNYYLCFSQSKAVENEVKQKFSRNRLNKDVARTETNHEVKQLKMNIVQRKNIEITGVLMGEYTTETIVGATIIISELNTTIYSDFDGTFKFNIPVNTDLYILIKYHGMRELHVKLDARDIMANDSKLNVGQLFLQKINSKQNITQLSKL